MSGLSLGILMKYLKNHGGVGEAQHDVTVVVIRQSLREESTCEKRSAIKLFT